MMNETTRALVRELGAALLAQSGTLAAAESCTGGGLGAAITDQAGSSAFFLGGIVAYDNRLKSTLLGVPESVLAEHGAVSLEVAKRMATGCLTRLGADVAVSVTGIAGPGGGTTDKPVGLVFIGVATIATLTAHELHFSGDRAGVRRQAIQAALRLALDAASHLDGAPPCR
jgi:PncC family amidohydrolase